MTLKSAGIVVWGGIVTCRVKYTKPPLFYEEQLQLKLKDRGLTITDDSRALRWLKRVGYFRLSGYFPHFRIPGSYNFKPGTTLEDIVNFYKFDAHLRLLILQAIDRVEVAIRAMVTYHLGHELGPFGYADPANFDPTFNHPDLMRLIAQIEEKSTELFVEHFRRTYTAEPQLPVWMVTELISFGSISKINENLRKSLRKKIAREFELSQSVFASWLHTLVYVRNLCAHHNRLWNRILSIPPELPNEWRKSGIKNDHVYAVLLMLEHLYRVAAPQAQWKSRLLEHFANNPSVSLNEMQIPANWREIQPWASPLVPLRNN